MKFRWIMMSIVALSLSSFVSACDQNKDHMPSPAKTPVGSDKAQDLPSSRTSEVPDPQPERIAPRAERIPRHRLR